MMLLADLIRAETEFDYAFQEDDDDESQLMDRADSVAGKRWKRILKEGHLKRPLIDPSHVTYTFFVVEWGRSR